MNTVVVGLQYGDEAKGKITDYLAKDFDVVVRYNGSCNTGATVWNNSIKYKFHHIPVGLLQNKICYIAPPCLIDPAKFLEEISHLKEQGIQVDGKLFISPLCHVITQDHISRDCATEQTLNGVGSTKRGVSPCASDKYARVGKRLFECDLADKISPYFADVSQDLNCILDSEGKILFEGAQGTLLDIDHGFYPFVSTSSNTAGAAPAACGIGPQNITNVVGVFKPYMTYVGNGFFATEVKNDSDNDLIVQRGYEYGTTTGRRRRVGWLDLPLLKYACKVNGVTELALAKVDVLEGMRVKYCVAYKSPEGVFLNNPMLRDTNNYVQEYVEEIFDIGGLVNLVESYVGVKVKYISYGKDRSDVKVL